MIYFDHSATTPVDKKVLAKILPYFSDEYGNPSSLHTPGQTASTAVEQARIETAEILNADPAEIIFTSGATESDNIAILGAYKGLKNVHKDKKLHIITTQIEHPGVFAPAQELERLGAEVTYLKVDKRGLTSVKELEKAIKDNTVLVSIMYVNSEVGSIQPIREAGKLIKKINEKRERDWKKIGKGNRPMKIYFHTDATQAPNFLDCDTKKLHVDMMSLSAHKIYGPKGVGCLFVTKGAPVSAVMLGGSQERGIRSGTLNTPGIVGFAEALKLATKDREKNNKKISTLRDELVKQIQKNIPDVVLNTPANNATPSHAHFSFLGVEGESILIGLDLEGIAVSTGSACASHKLQASHVLLAMGLPEEVAHNSIRFTLGKNNTKDEVKKTVKVLTEVIARLRKMAPK